MNCVVLLMKPAALPPTVLYVPQSVAQVTTNMKFINAMAIDAIYISNSIGNYSIFNCCAVVICAESIQPITLTATFLFAIISPSSSYRRRQFHAENNKHLLISARQHALHFHRPPPISGLRI